jgi:molybdopterin biosynthesis enzyme
MKKLIAAVLAGAALSTSAHALDAVTVANFADCPAGTAATVPVYEWQDGRFVRVGWKCESVYSGG